MPDYTIPNLKNACRILDYLASKGHSVTNAKIADDLNIPRSTVLRILHTLEQENYIKKDDKKNLLGANLIKLGQKAQQAHSVSDLARPILQQLTDHTSETSQLSVLSSDKVFILDVCASPHPLSAHSQPGTTADIHCSAAGKVLLAYLPSDSQSLLIDKMQLTRRTDNTITNKDDLRNELSKIRKQSYAIDEMEYHEGIRCLAAPVFDHSRQQTYTIGITASTSRFTKSKISNYSNYIKKIANTLTTTLGG